MDELISLVLKLKQLLAAKTNKACPLKAIVLDDIAVQWLESERILSPQYGSQIKNLVGVPIHKSSEWYSIENYEKLQKENLELKKKVRHLEVMSVTPRIIKSQPTYDDHLNAHRLAELEMKYENLLNDYAKMRSFCFNLISKKVNKNQEYIKAVTDLVVQGESTVDMDKLIKDILDE